MKRTKANQSVPPLAVRIHAHNSEKEDNGSVHDDKNTTDISSIRMLENLNIALFFSRAQSKIGEQKQ